MNSAALQMWIKSVEAQMAMKGEPCVFYVQVKSDGLVGCFSSRRDSGSELIRAPDLPELMEKVNAFVAKYEKPSQTITFAELKARQGYVDPRAVYGST